MPGAPAVGCRVRLCLFADGTRRLRIKNLVTIWIRPCSLPLEAGDASMMKLTLARKLALASLLFLFPIVYVVWTLAAQQNIAIDFGLKERAGTFYLRGLQAHGFTLARGVMNDTGLTTHSVSQ